MHRPPHFENLGEQSKISEILLCPACSQPLSRSKESIACDQGHIFPLRDGIPILAQDSSYHFLIPSAEQMQAALAIIDEHGFWPGMHFLTQHLAPQDKDELLYYMLNETRAAWKIFLPELETKRVLDYACGWGNLSVALARSAREVHGMDLSLQRIRFAKRYAAHEGLDNLHWVVGGDSPRLPYPDGYFDVVVLNGILEWIPTSRDFDKSPTDAQLSFLGELARITTNKGLICLAIENRFGCKYFFGARDEHSRLRFITLLPRFLANIYSTRARGKPFREYTHSIHAYKRLLARAGFSKIETFIPFPNYRHFDILVPYSLPRTLYTFFGKRRKRAQLSAAVTRLAPQFADAFVIFAGKTQQPTTYAIADKFSGSYPPLYDTQTRSWKVLGTGSALAYGQKNECGPLKSKEVVIKLALTPKAVISNRKSCENLLTLHNRTETPEWLKTMLPTSEQPYQRDGFDCSVQSRLLGTEGSTLAQDPDAREVILSQAVQLLIRMHEDTVLRETITSESYQKCLAPCLRKGLAHFQRFEQFRQSCAWVETTLENLLVGQTLPLVLCHGDYWLKNILFDPTTRTPTGIIDWDRMLFRGPPLTDLLNLLSLFQASFRKQNSFDTLAEIWSAMQPSKRSGWICDYFRRIPVPEICVNALCAVHFLQRLPETKLFATDADLRILQGLLQKR